MSQLDLKTAREVSEHLLNVTANALMTQDFDSFASAFGFPHRITTASSQMTVTTVAELRSAFENTCAYFQTQGVTTLERTCVAADFEGETRIKATHVSRIIRDGHDIMTPYPVLSVLERKDGAWKVIESDYALEDDTPQARAMLLAHADDPKAKAIYQEHLEVLSSALIANEFDRFAEHIQLPHRITTETETFDIVDATELRLTFDGFVRRYTDRGLTALVRVVTSARFITENEIVGTHRSHQLQGDRRVVQPYPNRVRLQRTADGKWRETHCANAVLNTSEDFRLWTRVSDAPRLPDLNLDPERTS